MDVELNLYRISETSDDTIGKLVDERGVFFCHTMEDEYREVKVKKETRIPAGRYLLGVMETITRLTEKYINDERLDPWFERHIEVKNVPGFKGVYIHIGNHDDHTDGCILLGLWKDRTKRYIEKSVMVYMNFYKIYYPIIKKGEHKVWLNIIDKKVEPVNRMV